MEIKYSDKELQLFVDAFKKVHKGECSLDSFKKIIMYDIKGVFYTVHEIPYQELPLHISHDLQWYRECVNIRLLLGK